MNGDIIITGGILICYSCLYCVKWYTVGEISYQTA